MKILSKALAEHLERADSLPWNLNIAERTLRSALGAALFTLPFYIHGPLTWEFAGLSFVGLYLGLTGSIGWDPVNALLHPEAHQSRDSRYASLPRQVLRVVQPGAPGDAPRPGPDNRAAATRPDRTGYDRAA